MSRAIIRDCSVAIKHIHRQETEKADALLHHIRADLNKFVAIRDPVVNADNNVLTAYQEYVEAHLFFQFARKLPFSTPQDLPSVPLLSYLLGMADLVGELRRYCLEHLRESSALSEANRAMEVMDDLYDNLVTLDYPSGLIPGVRRKTDVARSLVEKTRGDLTLGYTRAKLEERLSWFMERRMTLSALSKSTDEESENSKTDEGE